MQRVLVLATNKQPLMPCHPARARQLLRDGKAAIFRHYPFTIILMHREGGEVQATALKIDPGSQATGLALVADFQRGKTVVWAAVLAHRGQHIQMDLSARRSVRRSCRQRHTRYRQPRFLNRRRPDGWLPPSLMSRVHHIGTWTSRLCRFSPVTSLAQEWVRFDTQIMQNAEISGVEYQQGELQGYEVREYLLEKWQRQCAYCGQSDVPLEVEHIVPRARGGSNRVSNLTLACYACNHKKGSKTAAEFGYPDIQRKAKQPLKDATAVNVARWTLYHALQNTGLPVEVGTGGRTKYNRITQGYSKAHWIDAACVGKSGECVHLSPSQVYLHIQATGHGSRQLCRTDQYGFPSRHRLRQKRHFGFQTGDIVRSDVKTGKYGGLHTGRVACRATGRFDLKTADGKVTVKHTTCRLIHRSDGYTYTLKGEGSASSPC